MKNQARCVKHGGGTPQARRKAEERGQLEAARAAVERHGGEPVTDPFVALSDLAGEVTALKDELRARKGTPGADAAYERALDRAGRLLTDMTRVSVSARQVELERERMVADYSGAVVALAFGLATDLGHDTGDPVVQAVVSARLGQLATDPDTAAREPRRLTRR